MADLGSFLCFRIRRGLNSTANRERLLIRLIAHRFGKLWWLARLLRYYRPDFRDENEDVFVNRALVFVERDGGGAATTGFRAEVVCRDGDGIPVPEVYAKVFHASLLLDF